MTCYLAKIVYQIICGTGDHTPQFDEQLRLVTAVSDIAAFNRACEIGRLEEHSFLNQNKLMVQWKFINVSELYCMSDYADGAEVYSCIKERCNVDFYINEVHEKAARLQQNCVNHLMYLS